MDKRNVMYRILFFAFALSLLASCKSHEASNSYLEAKHHPSEEIAGEQKKAAKKAQKDFVKQQKKNNKAISKHGHIWSKKKKQYTN